MYKRILQKVYLLSAATLLVLSGCQKENQIGMDNASVIQTPYSLYAVKKDGMVVQSTNGEEFKFVFPPDGYAATQLLTAGPNLMMVKGTTLHMSRNEGKSFNPVYTTLRKNPWQNSIYYYAPFNKVFITSTQDRGVFYSSDYGETWTPDLFVAGLPNLYQVSSFSGLENGKLYAYSNVSNLTFIKTGPSIEWTPVTTISFYPTVGSEYYLISAANTLYLVDYNGIAGVWMSTDGAVTWSKLTNNQTLPIGVKYTGTVSPYGNKVVVVGTETEGIFRSDEEGVFHPTTGLPKGASVKSLTRKINIYKNNDVKIYLYAATSMGIYRSEDAGKTWFLSGNESWKDDYSAIY